MIFLLPKYMIRKKLCLIQIDSFANFHIIMSRITRDAVIIFCHHDYKFISDNINQHEGHY